LIKWNCSAISRFAVFHGLLGVLCIPTIHETLHYAICFYTEGVRLTTTGSPVLDLLKTIEAKGTRLILCSTCLNTLGLLDQVQVGIVGGMSDILEAQIRADKVVTL